MDDIPIQCSIKKLQVKFWLNMLEYKREHPNSALSKTLDMSEEENLHHLRYYIDLYAAYDTPDACQTDLQSTYKEKWTNKIKDSANHDPNSRLGIYLQVNPELVPWVPSPQTIMEFERKIVTRFRTGSHSLNVEVMRYSNIVRENRLCSCKNGVQDIWHIFMQCPLTMGINRRNYSNLHDVFQDENAHRNLIKITKRLKVPIGRI